MKSFGNLGTTAKSELVCTELTTWMGMGFAILMQIAFVLIRRAARRKKCIPAIDKMGECFAQCFEIESDARLVRFLKLEWNISATDPVSKFEEKFVERMTGM